MARAIVCYIYSIASCYRGIGIGNAIAAAYGLYVHGSYAIGFRVGHALFVVAAGR